VKYLKEPDPDLLRKPLVSAITRAYAVMLSEASHDWKPNAVVRVLSSGEMHPMPGKPHTLLVRSVCSTLHAQDYTHLFFRTEPRRPMRMLDRLTGPEVLRQRISYVLQDLFLTPANIGGVALVIDDIYNLGATAGVYAAALKRFCNVERVFSMNIAAARFSGGRDGWGRLSLDIDRFTQLADGFRGADDPADAFQVVWIVSRGNEFHVRNDCPKISGKAFQSLRFLAERERIPCPSCIVSDPRSAIRRLLLSR
jgi:hypothetical protein